MTVRFTIPPMTPPPSVSAAGHAQGSRPLTAARPHRRHRPVADLPVTWEELLGHR